MNLYLKYILIVCLLFLSNCKKNNLTNEKFIQENSIDVQMIETYKEGMRELERGEPTIAARKFNEAELLYPQSKWAPRSSLMSAYSYYSFNYYNDAIIELNRFLKRYPQHERTDYAYYLLAMSYYEQIVNEKKDLGPLLEAKKNFNIVIKKYPESDFALDAEYKMDLIEEIIASKEMYLARYYTKKEKWIPAINRYKQIVDNYSTTIYIEEALHRLVEIHYRLGLEDEAKKYATLLGYNYKSSEWYERSYKIFNKKYEKKKTVKKHKKTTLEKIKSLLK